MLEENKDGNEDDDEDQDEEEEEDKSEEENKDENEEANGMCCEAEKQGQGILGESSTRVLIDDASIRNDEEDVRISNLNFKRKGESMLCKSDQDIELSPSFGPPNKKLKMQVES